MCTLVICQIQGPERGPKILPPSNNRGKLGNSRGKLHFSIVYGSTSHAVWECAVMYAYSCVYFAWYDYTCLIRLSTAQSISCEDLGREHQPEEQSENRTKFNLLLTSVHTHTESRLAVTHSMDKFESKENSHLKDAGVYWWLRQSSSKILTKYVGIWDKELLILSYSKFLCIFKKILVFLPVHF